MTPVEIALSAFHFLRPMWLLLLPVVAGLWWAVRRRHGHRDLPGAAIAPHLRAALTVGAAARRRLVPVDIVAAVLTLAILGAAGPTWSRTPNPLVAQSAPLVVVLHVAASMQADDIAPSRLERGKQKIRDLLALRAGARSALVGFAGTAHVVVPMTEDAGILLPYLEGLSPEVMPRDGNRAGLALDLARSLLAAEAAPGGVLLVTDGIDPADVAAVDAPGDAVAILALLPEGTGDRGIDAVSAPVVRVTPDDSDIRNLDRRLDAAYRQALLEDTDQPWLDRGPWLAWPAAFLTLLWFRRGTTMRWTAAAALLLLSPAPGPARAGGMADWFFTPDQQGQIRMNRKDFAGAADAYADPLHRGYALFRAGKYEDAITVLDRVETAQAATIQGIAMIRARKYRDSIAAFQTALARDPGYPGAAENLETAQRILAYVEAMAEANDPGDQEDLGADEVAYDNTANRGSEVQMQDPQQAKGAVPLSSDQWMASIDTGTGDFLRQRFALEAAQGDSGGKVAE